MIAEENLLFLEAWRAVDKAYVDKTFNGRPWLRLREAALKKEPMTTRQETYAAIAKLLATLDDPFTRLIEPAKYEVLKEGTSGAVTGVGLEFGYGAGDQSAALVVVAPRVGSPAEAAGIKPLDVIAEIDGASTDGVTIYEAAQLLQGASGTSVSLGIRHPGSPAVERYDLQRAVVKLNPVQAAMCVPAGADAAASPPTGVIKLSQFTTTAALEFKKAYKALQGEGAARFVLDLRNNVGGSFPAGVGIGRALLNEGVIVNIADSDGIRDFYEANKTALDAASPLAVFVNGGTASASEVLSGALQDQKRATIVGERTYGKGLIQTLVNLSDGSGLAVTVAKYQTPNERDINKVGITPDVPLPVSDRPQAPEPFCGSFSAAELDALFGASKGRRRDAGGEEGS